MSTLWLLGGKLVVNGSGLPILCTTCPCPGGEFTLTCGDDYTVKDTLTVTLTFSGVSHSFSLVLDAEPTAPGHWVINLGASPWKPCGDGVFDVSFIDFYCTGDSELVLAVSGHNASGTLFTNFSTHINGMAVSTLVSHDPIHLIYNGEDLATSGFGVGTCNGTDSILSGEVTF